MTKIAKKNSDMLFFSAHWENQLQNVELDDFGALWHLAGELVEPMNRRRGGWSEVIRYPLDIPGCGLHILYIKRQQNQLRRGWLSWFRPKPTYWFEQRVISQLSRRGCFGPELIGYGERRSQVGIESLIVILELEGYRDLEQWLLSDSEQEKDKVMQRVGDCLSAMHRLKLEHGALYGKHILLNPDITDCRLIDFERARFRRNGQLAAKNDLERLFRRTERFSQRHKTIILAQYHKLLEFDMASLTPEQTTENVDKTTYKNRIKNDMEAAQSYTQRKPAKHQAEMATVLKALKYTDGIKTILDAPCGVGRATILLAKQGYEATGVDLGEAAVQVAREQVEDSGVTALIEQANLEQLQYADNSFDAILCFRLYHHFPSDDVRDRIVAELCRVSSEYVLISYLSPWAYTSIKRWLRAKLGGKPSRQYTTRLLDLEKKFGRYGFSLVKDVPQSRFFHTLHIAVFQRG